MHYALDGERLTIEDVVTVAYAEPGEIALSLSAEAVVNVERAREAVERFVAEGRVVRGVTTGLGASDDQILSPDQQQELQRNIVMSHAAGVGVPLESAIVRAMMLIRANSLAKGHSGIRTETVGLLLRMIERGVHPIVPSQGSLGASGDVAPLAHIALVMIGSGEAVFSGRRMSGSDALAAARLSPIAPGAKEGLALTKGTALMAALGALAVVEAENVAFCADIAAAISLEALHGTPYTFDPRLHAARPHPLQADCADVMRRLLRGSTLVRQADPAGPQDANSLRCIAQVHGSCLDAIKNARRVVEIELNSATDNPLIFWETDGTPIAISGGNSHGEPLALAFDYLNLGVTELGNISERRLARLAGGCGDDRILPGGLAPTGGVSSGFRQVQCTAAALASEDRAMVHPASADAIPSASDGEDHVSNGPVAGRRARHVIRNVERIVAMEILAAAQGIDFRCQRLPGARPGRGTQAAYELVRAHVPFLTHDEPMSPHMNAVWNLVAGGDLSSAVLAVLAA